MFFDKEDNHESESCVKMVGRFFREAPFCGKVDA